MAITLESTTSGDQGMLNRIGAVYSWIKVLDVFAGTDVPAKSKALQDLFDGGTAVERLSVDGVVDVQASLQNVDAAGLADLAINMLIDQVHADNPLPSLSLSVAMAEFIRQLKAGGYYVEANSVAAAATQSGLIGNGTVVVSTKNVFGYEMQNLIPEDLEVRVLSATSLRVQGQAVTANRLQPAWPTGSGADETYTPVIPDSADSLVTNGSFDAFTTNSPDDWTVDTGTPGTTIGEEASTVYRAGGKALKITGNGSQLTKISQDLAAVLEPHTQYALSFVCRMDSDPAAGAFKVDLFDGSAVINDEAGTANELAFSLTSGLSSGWVRKNVTFRTPDPLPASCKLRLFLTTALTTSRVLRIDDLTLSVMRQPSGDDRTPYLQFPDGSTPYSVDDNAPDGTGTFKITTTNNMVGKIQKAFQRMFNMVGLGLQLPYVTASTELDDTLFD